MSQWIKHRGWFRPVGKLVEVEVKTIWGHYDSDWAVNMNWWTVTSYRIIDDKLEGEWHEGTKGRPVPSGTIVETYTEWKEYLGPRHRKWVLDEATRIHWQTVLYWRAEEYESLGNDHLGSKVLLYKDDDVYLTTVTDETLRNYRGMLVKPVTKGEKTPDRSIVL
jgi:hypothetical protein